MLHTSIYEEAYIVFYRGHDSKTILKRENASKPNLSCTPRRCLTLTILSLHVLCNFVKHGVLPSVLKMMFSLHYGDDITICSMYFAFLASKLPNYFKITQLRNSEHNISTLRVRFDFHIHA